MPTAGFHLAGVTIVYGTPQAAKAIFVAPYVTPNLNIELTPCPGRAAADLTKAWGAGAPQPTAQRWPVEVAMFGIASDGHIEEEPGAIAIKRESAGQSDVDPEECRPAYSWPGLIGDAVLSGGFGGSVFLVGGDECFMPPALIRMGCHHFVF